METPITLFGQLGIGFHPMRRSPAMRSLLCLLLVGCGGTALQLEQATDSLSDPVPDLVSAQIYHNLLLKDQDMNEMPAQVVIASGSAQIANQIIVPSATVNLTGTIFRTFGLQNQNQWQQGWSVSAVSDTGDLQRLDALYRFAWGGFDNGKLGERPASPICRFVLAYSSAAIAATSTTIFRISDTDDPEAQENDYNDPQPAGWRSAPSTVRHAV